MSSPGSTRLGDIRHRYYQLESQVLELNEELPFHAFAEVNSWLADLQATVEQVS